MLIVDYLLGWVCMLGEWERTQDNGICWKGLEVGMEFLVHVSDSI